jgi:cytidylate kinase
MRLTVHDICAFAITQEDGQAVFDRVAPALKQGENVEIDFQGVTVFASPFFNAAVGQLLRDFKREDLRRQLKLENLTADGRDVVKQVIDNAEKYYASPDYRETQRKVLEAMAEEM